MLLTYAQNLDENFSRNILRQIHLWMDYMFLVLLNKDNTIYKNNFEIKPYYVNQWRILQEAGTININTDKTLKVLYKGVQCMMVGYAPTHKSDCYRIWKPKTNYMYEYRDLIWFWRKYYLNKSVATEQATVQLVITHVNREPATDIIEVREVNDDGTSPYRSDKNSNKNDDTNETYDA